MKSMASIPASPNSGIVSRAFDTQSLPDALSQAKPIRTPTFVPISQPASPEPPQPG